MCLYSNILTKLLKQAPSRDSLLVAPMSKLKETTNSHCLRGGLGSDQRLLGPKRHHGFVLKPSPFK